MVRRSSSRASAASRWCCVLLLACLPAGGCAWNWNKLKGEGFQDEMSDASRNLRPKQSDGQPLGTSAKALEIESNLGYR